MELKPDLEIIQEVLNGNTDAFESLVIKYQERTFGICFKILRDKDKAEEAAHLSFIKAFENLGKFRKDARFSTWFYRIVYNICLDQHRYDKRMVREVDINIHDDWSPVEINAGLDYLGRSERKKYIAIALESLSHEEAALIHQYYEEEFSIEELTEITGLKASNVKIRLYRARKKMYGVLEKHLKDEVKNLVR